MRHIVVLVVALLLSTIGMAWAGEAAYKLVMSKNKELCTNMLKLFKADMKQYGEIHYEEHDIFKRIPWKSVDISDERYPNYGCSSIKQAIFDINNDDNNELVIKWSGCLRDQLTDRIYIFPTDNDVLSKLKPGPGGLKPLFNTRDKLELSGKAGQRYVLKELPIPMREKLMEEIKKQMSELLKKGLIKEDDLEPAGIGGVLSLQPFIWKETTYISMTDLHQEWIVIAKYLQRETLEDICYFHGKSLIKP